MSMETVTEGGHPPMSPFWNPTQCITDCTWQVFKRCLWIEPMNVTQTIRFENLELLSLTCSFYREELFFNRVPPTQIMHPLFHVSNPRHVLHLPDKVLPDYLCADTLQSYEFLEILVSLPHFFLPFFPSFFLSWSLQFISYALYILFTYNLLNYETCQGCKKVQKSNKIEPNTHNPDSSNVHEMPYLLQLFV